MWQFLWPNTWHLRHWLHCWQLRTTLLTITLWPLNKEWWWKHLQFLRCFYILDLCRVNLKKQSNVSMTMSGDIFRCRLQKIQHLKRPRLVQVAFFLYYFIPYFADPKMWKLNFPECVKCYSCGYMKWDDSETQKLPGDVPFCNGQFQDVKHRRRKTEEFS